MVKELYVEEAPKQLDWNTETQFIHEFVFGGVPLPDDYEELLKERHNYVPADRVPEAVASEKLWDHYMVSIDSVDLNADPRSPRERLNEFFKEVK